MSRKSSDRESTERGGPGRAADLALETQTRLTLVRPRACNRSEPISS